MYDTYADPSFLVVIVKIIDSTSVLEAKAVVFSTDSFGRDKMETFCRTWVTH